MNANGNPQQFLKAIEWLTAIHVKVWEIDVQHLKTRVLRILFSLLTWDHQCKPPISIDHQCEPPISKAVDDWNPAAIQLFKFIPNFITFEKSEVIRISAINGIFRTACIFLNSLSNPGANAALQPCKIVPGNNSSGQELICDCNGSMYTQDLKTQSCPLDSWNIAPPTGTMVPSHRYLRSAFLLP